MANSETSTVVQQLCRVVLLRDGAGMTDGQLLDCFLTQRDDAAFAALVRRHGPMVWGVCRRVLGNHHDAEDAFQATFLVLVRRAACVEPREMVANWLYGVARQTALKATAVAARRKERERQVVEMPEPAFEDRKVWHDLQPVLDQELSRLPDKYRVPIVLCDLEGLTRAKAARQLGWPEGTVAGRLATARKMLAGRLARRGVTVSVGTLGAVLSRNTASAGVPTAVVSATIKAAGLFAVGQAAGTGAISANVAALTEVVLKTIPLTTLKLLMVLCVIAGLTGAAGLIYQTRAAEQPKAIDGMAEALLLTETEQERDVRLLREVVTPRLVEALQPLLIGGGEIRAVEHNVINGNPHCRLEGYHKWGFKSRIDFHHHALNGALTVHLDKFGNDNWRPLNLDEPIKIGEPSEPGYFTIGLEPARRVKEAFRAMPIRPRVPIAQGTDRRFFEKVRRFLGYWKLRDDAKYRHYLVYIREPNRVAFLDRNGVTYAMDLTTDARRGPILKYQSDWLLCLETDGRLSMSRPDQWWVRVPGPEPSWPTD